MVPVYAQINTSSTDTTILTNVSVPYLAVRHRFVLPLEQEPAKGANINCSIDYGIVGPATDEAHRPYLIELYNYSVGDKEIPIAEGGPSGVKDANFEMALFDEVLKKKLQVYDFKWVGDSSGFEKKNFRDLELLWAHGASYVSAHFVEDIEGNSPKRVIKHGVVFNAPQLTVIADELKSGHKWIIVSVGIGVSVHNDAGEFLGIRTPYYVMYDDILPLIKKYDQIHENANISKRINEIIAGKRGGR